MFGAINFLPLYQQTVQGASATNSGLLLLPMMLAMHGGVLVVGRAITRTGRYKVFPIIGGVGMTGGMLLLSLMDVSTTRLQTGSVYGRTRPRHGLPDADHHADRAEQRGSRRTSASASSAATFFRSIGGSFGVSLFGAIFVRHLHDDVARQLGAQTADRITKGGGQVDPTALQAMPSGVKDALFHGIASSLSTVFVWAIPFAAVVAVLAFLIKEIPLRGETTAPAGAEADATTPAPLRAAVE